MDTAITVLEACLLGAAAAPGARLAANRKLARLFPRAHGLVVGLLVVWTGVVVLAAVYVPTGLHALAAVGGLALLATAVRARPSFGRHRGLPDGSLSLRSSVEALAERRFYLNRAARLGPIFKMAQFHRGVVCVVGLERGHRLLREHAGSLTSSPLPFSSEISGSFLRYMDDDTHATYGPLFRRALAKPVIEAAAPVTAEAARRELLRVAEDCSLSKAGAVRPGAYLERIVQDAFVRAMLGVLPESAEYREFETSYRALVGQDLSAPLSSEAKQAMDSLRGFLRRQTERLGGAASEDGLVCTLSELRRLDPRMPDQTCLDNILFTVKISTGNVVGLLHWILAFLGRHPEWTARVRDELEAELRAGEPDFVDRVILETLRLAQSEYLYRTVTDDIEYEGFRLPKGWLLRLCVWESHRDPEIFSSPETFDPDRFLSRRFQGSEYSPFGFGRHACNGVAFTSMICRAVIAELVTGFDWSAEGEGPEERDFRHWRHWRPGADFRLRLAPRPGGAATSTDGSAVAAGSRAKTNASVT